MKRPHFTDRRPRYRSAEQSRTPGYLAHRLRLYARLPRMKARHNVIPLRSKAA
jgi:hypothetical protein